MIRRDREVTDIDDILDIISKCDVCRIALNGDDGYPYIVPLNFGYNLHDGIITLFFHSALHGKKHELIAIDSRASFEMDCSHHLFSVEERGYCTMNYESVTGHGMIEYVTDEAERLRALTLMTDRYHNGKHFEFNTSAMPRTSVYKLTVTDIVGKLKQSKP